MEINGTRRDETSFILSTGHIVHSIRDDSAFVGTPYLTGWVAGSLYVSRNGGATWKASDLRFGA